MSDDGDTEADEPVMDRSEPTDEQQTEREWHLWLFAILVVAGGLLIAFPPDVWPQVGIAVVAAAAAVWLLKTAIEWTE